MIKLYFKVMFRLFGVDLPKAHQPKLRNRPGYRLRPTDFLHLKR